MYSKQNSLSSAYACTIKAIIATESLLKRERILLARWVKVKLSLFESSDFDEFWQRQAVNVTHRSNIGNRILF